MPRSECTSLRMEVTAVAVKNAPRAILLTGGVLVLAVALLGDVIGGAPGFGTQQIAGTIVGAVAILVALRLKSGQRGNGGGA